MQVVGPDGTVLTQAPAPPPDDLPAAGAEDAIMLAAELDRGERLNQALDAWYRRRLPQATLVQNYSAALMRQEQGEPTDADLRLLELPMPAVQGRLASPT